MLNLNERVLQREKELIATSAQAIMQIHFKSAELARATFLL